MTTLMKLLSSKCVRMSRIQTPPLSKYSHFSRTIKTNPTPIFSSSLLQKHKQHTKLSYNLNNHHNFQRIQTQLKRFYQNPSTENLLNRLQNGQITKSEVQNMILQIEQIQKGSKYESNSIPLGNVINPNGLRGGGPLPFANTISLGSRANPLHMKKQTSFKEFLFSLFPFVFIFWVLGGFDMVRKGRVGQGGVGGMFGNNYTEWDETDWEDDESEEIEGDSDEKLQEKMKDRDMKNEEDRREAFFSRLGIHLKDGDKLNPDGDSALLGSASHSDQKQNSRKKKKRVRFKDVCGNDEAKVDLKDLVDYLKNPEKYQEMGCKLPKGVLMSGPPGTGKTLMARALAGEAGVPFLATNGASFDEVFVGVGVMRVKKLFERAKERSPCIVFIDEIDAIANTRMQMGTAHSSDSLNALLSEMDGFEQNSGVIVIAATNMSDRLDPALIRPGRFDRKVAIQLPSKQARADIIRLYLGDRGEPNVYEKLDELVSDISGFSGADLESMVNLASIETVKEGHPKVSLERLIDAKEIISMGRAQRTLDVGMKTRKVTAYHEAGHAIVSLYTKGAKPIYKATILPRGGALGFVASMNEDEFMSTKESLLAQLDVCMGGRAAEEIFNGNTQITTGASSDFNQATQIATAMVCQYGMSARVGKVFYRKEEVNKLSPSLQNLINEEVKRLIDESFYRSRSLIMKHKEDLELLATTLIEKETLSGDAIKELVRWDEKQAVEPVDHVLAGSVKHKRETTLLALKTSTKPQTNSKDKSKGDGNNPVVPLA